MRNERFDDAVSAILSTDTRYPREAYTLITMLSEFGPFAKGLLEDLNINSTDDIGELVYNLIEVGAFGKTDSDKKSDFHAVYDFEETFVLPFRCEHD